MKTFGVYWNNGRTDGENDYHELTCASIEAVLRVTGAHGYFDSRHDLTDPPEYIIYFNSPEQIIELFELEDEDADYIREIWPESWVGVREVTE